MSGEMNATARRETQLIEHNLQQLTMQKQSMQFELNELTNALSELGKTTEEVYRVMGNIMMRAKKEDLQKELEEKKSALELHMQALERQEKIFETKRLQLQRSTVDKISSEKEQ